MRNTNATEDSHIPDFEASGSRNAGFRRASGCGLRAAVAGAGRERFEGLAAVIARRILSEEDAGARWELRLACADMAAPVR